MAGAAKVARTTSIMIAIDAAATIFLPACMEFLFLFASYQLPVFAGMMSAPLD